MENKILYRLSNTKPTTTGVKSGAVEEQAFSATLVEPIVIHI